VLPSGLGAPEPDPGTPSNPSPAEVLWLQPLPDRLVSPESADPAAVVAGREGLRLALIASLQYLPGRQRAVLILRDVLAFSAAEVAVMLDTSTTAVKSTLQRARARLAELGLAADDIAEPVESEARALLEQYIAAFEAADATALGRLLCRDATLEATPFLNWYAGKKACVAFLHLWILGAAGDWRMRPTSANGQPAAACYVRDAHGVYQGYGIVMLTATDQGISRIVSFGDAGLLHIFGFPPVWSN
jgi:RNA polymerase sigma-70 factor (ECF subfamily)